MTTNPKITVLFEGRGKTLYGVEGLGPLTKDPYIKRYPYLPDPKVSEEDLLPPGKKILLQLRACRLNRSIREISIGPKNFVLYFGSGGGGNPYGLNSKRKSDEEKLLSVLRSMQSS